MRFRTLALALIALLFVAPVHAASSKARVAADATRLASLLHDVQWNVSVSDAAWKTIANEANSLANRIYGNTSANRTARGLARDLRMHVREMRKAALAGDAAGARQHAQQAMPFVNKLIDWAE
ncbi:MAG TPA: hypothetical protein VN181_13160 [Thermoanaerobaculia bacterium]|nr:hypothetical protein [Thermoanaerobaculia bacterium]